MSDWSALPPIPQQNLEIWPFKPLHSTKEHKHKESKKMKEYVENLMKELIGKEDLDYGEEWYDNMFAMVRFWNSAEKAAEWIKLADPFGEQIDTYIAEPFVYIPESEFKEEYLIGWRNLVLKSNGDALSFAGDWTKIRELHGSVPIEYKDLFKKEIFFYLFESYFVL